MAARIRTPRPVGGSLQSRLARILLLSLLAAPAPVRAQEPPRPDSASVQESTVAVEAPPAPVSAEPEAAPAPAIQGEPVYLGGRVLLEIRDRHGLESLRKRAGAIRRRLDAVIRDRAIDPRTAQAVPVDSAAVVLVGDVSVLTVTPRDVEPGTFRSPLARARALLPALREGIERERSQLAPLRLLTSIGLSLLLLLLSFVAVRLGVRLWASAAPALRERIAGILPGIRLGGLEVLSAQRAARLGERTTLIALLAAGLMAAYFILSLIFSFFPWTQGWSHRLMSFAFRSTAAAAASVLGALPGLVLAAVVLYLFYLLIRFVSGILDRAAVGWITIPGLHPELARPTKQLIRVALWVAAVIIVYPLIPGSQSAAFRGVSILLGVMVSLGSVGLVDNLLAGLILTYARSYRIGERISAGEVTGDVIAQGLLTTKVRTIKNEEVTVGNSQILKTSVTNYSRRAGEEEGLILHTAVTIGYDAPWRRVHELLIEAARATEGIEADPEPFVLQKSLDDFYVHYEINATTRRPAETARLLGLLHQNIQDAFNRGGIEILSPHYASLRDGNTITIPEAGRKPGARPGAIRIETRTPGS
jgi:small-conductance mechanosensitive channel